MVAHHRVTRASKRPDRQYRQLSALHDAFLRRVIYCSPKAYSTFDILRLLCARTTALLDRGIDGWCRPYLPSDFGKQQCQARPIITLAEGTLGTNPGKKPCQCATPKRPPQKHVHPPQVISQREYVTTVTEKKTRYAPEEVLTKLPAAASMVLSLCICAGYLPRILDARCDSKRLFEINPEQTPREHNASWR